MFFPLSGVTISPVLLAGIGFLVGILGGFFGVGGGFIAGPMMFWSGVPMNFVIGTDLAHMTGKSIVAAKRHRALGHVDVKLGILMIVGTVIGVEVGARIIEALETTGKIDVVIGVTYVVILLTICAFTAWESLRALRMIHYSAWLARRWQDPAFPLHFPWFNTPRYWEEQLQQLREQMERLAYAEALTAP